MIALAGGSVGLQIGAGETDVVFTPMATTIARSMAAMSPSRKFFP